jgi:L-ascorbate metabolism protein UlaG (beta-lactamase superfamily)
VSFTFRWLGVAGLELKAGEQVLAIDPFFTRPSIGHMLHPVVSNTILATEKLPHCHFVLVTHAHYDHLLDVPAVLQHTGAIAYGSANTCQLLRLLGTPSSHVHEVHAGDQLNLGDFSVQVIPGHHSHIPLERLFNNRLPAHLKLPLHVWDYRMDVCLGYCITVRRTRLLLCAADPRPAEVLFAVAQESSQYFVKLFQGAQPHLFVPIHWDNFTRPLNKPLTRLTRPGRMALAQLASLARHTLPDVNVIIPELFKEYPLPELL